MKNILLTIASLLLFALGAAADVHKKSVPLTDGANLRILDWNIWGYNKDTIPDAWKKIGKDPRRDARAPMFAEVINAYHPDLINLQEFNRKMYMSWGNLLRKANYRLVNDENAQIWCQTPIFYNPETIEVVERNAVNYVPYKFAVNNSKSYTVAVFRHKKTGKKFAVLNTHLWWQSEQNMAGSDYARISQVYTMMAEAETVKKKYNCPIFVTGDMNATEHDSSVSKFIEAGYKPCYKIATKVTDNRCGVHQCGPEGYSLARAVPSKPTDREKGAIDHCLLYNAQEGTEIVGFICDYEVFISYISDHYPNIIDAKL